MSVRRVWVVVATIGVLGACADQGVDTPIVTTAPVEAPPATVTAPKPVMFAEGERDVEGSAGETRSDFPRVRVRRSGTREGIAGVAVTFTRPSTGVSRVVITDSLGIASFGTFTFGTEYGTEELFAAAAGQSPITFSGTIRAPIVARYDLVDVAGQRLPIAYSGGGKSWEITGAHYLLRSDGTYDFFYDGGVTGGGMAIRPTGRYVRSDATIDFYIFPPYGSFYAARNGHFSRGVLEVGAMIVDYDDPVDFERERYVPVAVK